VTHMARAINADLRELTKKESLTPRPTKKTRKILQHTRNQEHTARSQTRTSVMPPFATVFFSLTIGTTVQGACPLARRGIVPRCEGSRSRVNVHRVGQERASAERISYPG